jgi:asparagine N-glycosylation enzyme membrane subunit Stt3
MQKNRLALGPVLGFVLLLVALVSWAPREALHRRVHLFGHAEWVTTDPDTLYHVRRVERVLDEGLPVAERDPLLNAPHGSAIPWPPYYTLLVSALVAPFAPAEPAARREWLEPAVASLARLFSVLTSVTAALAAAWLVGRPLGSLAALLAGLLHALTPVAVAYGKSGNGDHHAFVSWLALLLLVVLSRALSDDVLADKRRALRLGAAAGAIAGAALGAWVASLMYVVQAQLVLGLLVVAHSRKPRPGVALLGLAFHLSALSVLAPALAASAWRVDAPFSVVNLSWFHAAFLALGAAVFAPLVVARSASFLRAWPWIVLAILALLGAWVALGDGAGPLAVREGFAWAGRTDAFMARIEESRRLVGEGAGDELFRTLGYASALLPFALLALAWSAWSERSLGLLLWCVAALSLALQSASQARFAEALSAPLAVVLAWAGARAAGRVRLDRAGWAAPFLAVGVPVALSIALQWPTLALWRERVRTHGDAAKNERAATLGVRLACDWIATQAPLEEGESALAVWGHGHVIEWAARRASVATNFGAYVGEAGFRAPPRWFMAEDEREGEALLEAHRVRYVIVDSDLPNALNSLIEYGAPERRARYVGEGAQRGGQVRPEWFHTLGARALFDGYLGPRGVDGSPFGGLRLAWVAPLRDAARPLRSPGDLAPAAMVWERVRGAVVEARSAVGDELRVELDLVFPTADKNLRWRGAAKVADDGVARLRMPYATEGANTEARPLGRARFAIGARSGEFDVREADVREGRIVATP